MSLVKRPSFETEARSRSVLLSNIKAIEQNTRYVEEDLNRCYFLADLQNEEKSKSTLERKRAREAPGHEPCGRVLGVSRWRLRG
eukprot:Skav223885  [mRNA]  locus=scaffold1226:640155:641126:- [translate_table: standard]